MLGTILHAKFGYLDIWRLYATHILTVSSTIGRAEDYDASLPTSKGVLGVLGVHTLIW
jgi:hypothetical protein